MGIPFPEQYGGIGSDYLAYCIAVEDTQEECVRQQVLRYQPIRHLLVGRSIHLGSEAQKQQYLRPLAQGEKIGAYGLTEPGFRLRCWWHENNS